MFFGLNEYRSIRNGLDAEKNPTEFMILLNQLKFVPEPPHCSLETGSQISIFNNKMLKVCPGDCNDNTNGCSYDVEDQWAQFFRTTKNCLSIHRFLDTSYQL